jgi:hypothetical protein
MGLVRTALIFGAGYVLGRPEGRAKVAELAKRPEVAQLRQQAASTVSSGLKMGKKQVAEATDKVTDKATDQVSEQGSAQINGSGMTTGTGGWRGRRLPSFPRRGARHAAPAGTATTPLGTEAGTATTGGGTSTGPVLADTVSAGTTPTGAAPTGTTPTAKSPTGTASTEPEVPPVPPHPAASPD